MYRLQVSMPEIARFLERNNISVDSVSKDKSNSPTSFYATFFIISQGFGVFYNLHLQSRHWSFRDINDHISGDSVSKDKSNSPTPFYKTFFIISQGCFGVFYTRHCSFRDINCH